MAFCTHCGSPLPEGAKSCPKCGQPVEETPLSASIKKENDQNSQHRQGENNHQTSLILGIVSLVVGGVVGTICGLIGLLIDKKSPYRVVCLLGFIFSIVRIGLILILFPLMSGFWYWLFPFLSKLIPWHYLVTLI